LDFKLIGHSSFPQNGVEWEPWESIDIEVPGDKSAHLIEKMGVRYADLKNMTNDPQTERARMHFEISSRNFFGMRSWITTATGGEAVVTSELLPMRPRDRTQELKKERNGVFVSNTTGQPINMCDFARLSMRGKLFISPEHQLYMGMIMGELREGKDDIDTNICHKHDGYEKAKNCQAGVSMNLEESLTYIADDECLEVTPKRVCMRKIVLDSHERKILSKEKKKDAMRA